MRLITPLIIALFGAAVGVFVNYLFVKSWLTRPASAIIGGTSAFLGLITRDILDATLFSSDQLLDALLAAILMSFIVSVIAHVITSFYTPKNFK